MRGYRRHLAWAVGVSLVCHVALVGALFFALPGGHSARLSADSPINTKISVTEDFQPVTLAFDNPAPRMETPSLPVTSVTVAKIESLPEVPNYPNPPQYVSMAPASASPPASPPGSTGAGASTSVAPLHGPFTRSGLSIVYVLDHSGSMGQGKKLARAIGTLKASLQQLGPECRFQIVAYDSQATVFRLAGNLELALANKKNIADAVSMLDELAAEGSSRHVEGLRTGLLLHPDLLILLTDAGDLSAADAKKIKQWNQKGTAIHAVLFGAATGENVDSLCDLAGPKNVHFVP